MVGSAKPAMRNKYFAKLPKLKVLNWVLLNKIKTIWNVPINYKNYIDYNKIYEDKNCVRRKSYLNLKEKKILQPSESRHYEQLEKSFNK